MLIDHPLVSRKLFYPRQSSVAPSLGVDVPGARLGCFLFQRYPDAGTLLHFHGNGELAAEYAAHYAEWFLALGVNVCFAEYRGYGASTGTPALAAMLPDGEKIVAALGVAPDRVVAFGRSLGSLYAVELARRLPQLAGLVLESAIADVAERVQARVGDCAGLPGTPAELQAEARSQFDHEAVLRNCKAPLLVLHAEHDSLVDRSHADRLHAWGGGDRRLVVFANGDHNTILFDNVEQYTREVDDFLRRTGITTRHG